MLITLRFLTFALVLLAGLGPLSLLAQDKPIRLIAEAEDFKPLSGWQVLPYRENYYASTFALTFLSRMGALAAPEQLPAGQEAIAEQAITLPAAGEFTVLVRYEQPYDYSVEFDVEVLQAGKTVARLPFGRLDQVKIWGCMGTPEARRTPMARFFWGATDNIVWQEGAAVKLAAGPATLRLIAGPQMDGLPPRQQAVHQRAAARHVDLVCLTNDAEGMLAQRNHAGARTYLEFDGWLVQQGDLFVRFFNPANGQPAAPTLAALAMGQHSPYYVHHRDWPSIRVLGDAFVETPSKYQLTGPRALAVAAGHLAPRVEDAALFKTPPPERFLQPGKQTAWIPIGHLMDALHNSGWSVNLPSTMTMEFGVPDGQGGLKVWRSITGMGKQDFEIPGVVAPNPVLRQHLVAKGREPVLRTNTEALEWLLAEVRKFPKVGKTPQRMLHYSILGFSGALGQYQQARDLALALGDNTAVGQEGKKRGIICHWRDPSEKFISEKAASGALKDLYIVSYGDETHLPQATVPDEIFKQWLSERGIKVPGEVKYTKQRTDPLFYYSMICGVEYGAKPYVEASAAYAKHGIRTGANYSPHANYLVTEMHYIRPFKLQGLTMPWSEDYVWQIPEFSVQVTGYLTTAFRAGAKYHQQPIHMYIMPHSPGNTPRSFTLSYYTAVAHGAKMINYFCATPLAVGGTENYIATDDLAMWRAVHDRTHEAGIFEDYIMDGQVRQAKVAMLLSSVDDIYTDVSNTTLAMHNNERKALYYALRHAGVEVDFISEDDLVDGLAKDYQVIYVTQQYLHSKALSALKAWVTTGGTAVAMVGGGFLDEFQAPSKLASELYGVAEQAVQTDPQLLTYLKEPNRPFLTKQDLPGYQPMTTVKWQDGERGAAGVPVIVWRQTLKPSTATVIGTFADGSPAVLSQAHGKGRAVLFGFLPGQAYLKGALPLRPVDRGSHDGAFTHFIPTQLDPGLRAALVDAFLPGNFTRPVLTSEPLVESTCIDTVNPRRLAVPLINYSAGPLAELTVRLPGVKAPKQVRSVRHGVLKATDDNGALSVTLPLADADMLLLDL